MATVNDRGRLLEAAHSSTSELTGSDWQLRTGYGKVTLWVNSTRGGTLKVYRIPNAGVAADKKIFDTQVIPAGELTPVTYCFRIFKGVAGFSPADSLSGTTTIDLEASP